MAKNSRLGSIKEIISNQTIQNQDELQKALLSKGFNVTQATLSRDLRELSIVKANIPGRGFCYTFSFPSESADPKVSRNIISTDPIRSVEFSSNLGVVRTYPGFAGAVASLIDAGDVEGIMGTIAGDDCILLILREGADKKSVITTLSRLMPGIAKKVK